MALTFRDSLLRALPRWLANRTIGKVAYAIGLHADLLGDAVIAGIRKRFPEDDSEDAAATLGRDRVIIRGRDEPWETYQPRLRAWLDSHRIRGNPYALLRQLYAFWAAAPREIELYYAGTNRRKFSMNTLGEIVRGVGTWLATDHDTKPAQWLLTYQWPNPLPDPIDWGAVGETWGGGRVWGSGLTSQEIADLRRVPAQWGNAHSRGRIRLANGFKTVEFSIE